MIDIQINKQSLVLPSGFSTEWEENNYAFEDDAIFGDHSIPMDLPIHGNEIQINYAHLLNTADKVTIYENALFFDNGQLVYTGRFAITQIVHDKTIRCAFLVDDFYFQIKDKTINTVLENEPLVDDATTNALYSGRVVAETEVDVCFPEIQVDNLYGDDAFFPNEIIGNKWDDGLSLYELASNFSRPLIPFFFLTSLVRKLVEAVGYSAKGNFFSDPRFANIAVTHMATMDKANNPNDFAFKMIPFTYGGALSQYIPVFPAVLAPVASVFYIEGNSGIDTQINSGEDFVVDFQFDWGTINDPPVLNHGDLFDPYDTTGYVWQYLLEWRLVVYDVPKPTSASQKMVVDFGELRRYPGLTGTKSIRSRVSTTITNQPSYSGKYLMLEVKFSRNKHHYSMVGMVGALISQHYSSFKTEGLNFGMRYLGATGSELVDPEIDYEFLLPKMQFTDFLKALKTDYNVAFALHPYRKEVEFYCCDHLLERPIDVIDYGIQKNYQSKLQKYRTGYTFVQEFKDAEFDADAEDNLVNRDFVGFFDGVSNFPSPALNQYCVDQVSNIVYVSQWNISGFSIFAWGTGSYSWQKSHWRAPNKNFTVGNGAKEMQTTFLPLMIDEDSGSYTLVYSGKGKSKHVDQKSEVETFRAVNYFGKRTGYTKPEARSTNYYHNGTSSSKIDACMNLNYDPENPDSIFSRCFSEWLQLMMNATEFEMVFLYNEMYDKLEKGNRKQLGNALFLVKQMRMRRNMNGQTHIEATTIRIK